MRRGDGARCWPSWLAPAGVALAWGLASALGWLLVALLGAERAGAAEEPRPIELTFQAVRCDDWPLVPGNLNVSPLLDDTGGRYVTWGPALDAVVSAQTPGDLPPGCTFVNGVVIRATSVEHGHALVPIATNHQPPGAEDGITTSQLGSTGTSGPGQLVVASATLTGPQQQALADHGPGDGGLWVAADLSSQPTWSFANLRCHRDTYNADNREVIRPSPVDDSAACVLYVVGAAGPADSSSTPPPGPAPLGNPTPPTPGPTVSPAPVPPPAAETASPPSPGSPSPPPPGAPTQGPPAVEGEPAPAPPGADPPTGPGQESGSADAELSGPLDPGPRPDGAVPPDPAVASGSLTPAPLPGAPPGPLPGPPPGGGPPGVAAPPTVLPDGGGSLDPLRPPAPGLPIAPLPQPPGTSTPGPSEPPPTTMALLVEVGGVTRGTPADRPGGARSPWVRPVVVDLSCGATRRQRVEVPVGHVPGFQVESDPVVLPDGDRRCQVLLVDDGTEPPPGGDQPTERTVDGGAPPAVIRIDGQQWPRGVPFPVLADEPGERLVKVTVTFAALPLESPMTRRPSPPAPSSDQPISPALTAGLAGLFALGLAGAVARARRPG